MIKKVNWPQAIGEVLLLFLGAGVALGLDGWNDRRLDRLAEDQYLASLRKDFEDTQAVFIRTIQRNKELRDNNIRLLNTLSRSSQFVPKDSIIEPEITLFWVYRFYPVLGTYQDLMRSGKLELIRSDSLRIALGNFEVLMARLDQNVDEGFNLWNQIEVPYFLEHVDLRDLMGGQYRGLDLSLGRPSGNLDAYRNQEFLNLLAVVIMQKQDMVLPAEACLRAIDQILRLIDEAMARTGP